QQRLIIAAGDVDDGRDAAGADPISDVEQYLLRQYLQQAELGDARRSWKDGFAQWMICTEPALRGWSRLEHEIYRRRAELRRRFPLRRIARFGVRAWLIRGGLSELRLTFVKRADLQAPRWWRRAAPGERRDPCDVHVVGFLDSRNGLGTSGRYHRDALEGVG